MSGTENWYHNRNETFSSSEGEMAAFNSRHHMVESIEIRCLISALTAFRAIFSGLARVKAVIGGPLGFQFPA
jgi:hypothetical protein